MSYCVAVALLRNEKGDMSCMLALAMHKSRSPYSLHHCLLSSARSDGKVIYCRRLGPASYRVGISKQPAGQ
jgi:hypothetical protein